MRKLLIAALAGLAIGSSGVVVGAATMGAGGVAAEDSDTYRQLALFGDVFERIRADYVEQVDDRALVEAAINGMLTSLDPHSSYLPPKGYRDMQIQTRGEFGGLGIEVTMENGVVKVVAPIDDTPAAKANILSGDYITHIDGEQVLGLTLGEAVERMRGAVDTDIRLTIARQGEAEPFDVTLRRAIIKIRAVRHRVEGDIGYMRITQFNETVNDNLRAAVEDIKKQLDGKVAGYVLDLRNNPGGLLDQAVAVSDAFLEQGEIVSTRGRKKDDMQRYSAHAGDIADGKPVIVLVNGGSASASEIVAGALQDHRRGVILGTRTFGKGSVQTIMPLDGEGAIRLTTARYYTPSGRSIQAKGIDPDIVVDQARIEKVGARASESEADLPGHLDNPDGGGPDAGRSGGDAGGAGGANDAGGPGAGAGGGDAGAAAANDEATSEETDYQLHYALDLLHGLDLIAQQREEL